MKLIKSIVRPNKVDDVKDALAKLSISGMTVTEVRGHGKQKGHTAIYRGKEYNVSLLPKMEIEIVVPDGIADDVVKAVVLVGGEGTRLRPLTSTVPKPLLPIAGQPFVERQLTWLARHGVTEAVLSLGYLPDAFRAHFTDDEFGGVRLRYAVEPEPLGTAGGIRFAADSAEIDERFVVCNGDVLTTLDLDGLVRFHDERDADDEERDAGDDPHAHVRCPPAATRPR